MIGNNSIELNEATIKAALQYYFEKVLFSENSAPEVTGITANSTYAGATFKVTTAERVKP